MPSLEENVTKIAAFYAAQASYYHDGTYGNFPGKIDYGRLKTVYQDLFSGLDVLEIAAGTGYWTEVLACTARTVIATDINTALVESAKERLSQLSNVTFRVANAYTLDTLETGFSAAFAHYWWSHMPRKKWHTFLSCLHSKLRPNALVLFSDNLPYEAEWVKRRIDEHGDIYEERSLRSGEICETIKNFPNELELRALIDKSGYDAKYSEYEPEHIWSFSYRVRTL